MKVLVVEDEKGVASAVTRLLTEAGHAVTWAPDGELGLKLGATKQHDLIVLDVMLPKLSGWEVVAELRKARVNGPVLMLTAKDDLHHKVKGLTLGADDYLPKPFEPEELVARVQALLRRDVVNKGSAITIDDLVIERKHRRVTRGGKVIGLTRREYDLLEALAVNENRTLSKQTIQERVWGDDASFSNTVEVYIGILRKKIDSGFSRRLIHTVVGFGYVLRTEV